MVLPKCWFDGEKCYNGILALKNYQKKWDAKHKTYSNKPRHDWSSNGADAFGYFALESGHERKDPRDLPRRVNMEYDIFNYGG
jgi:hypothetical protein